MESNIIIEQTVLEHFSYHLINTISLRRIWCSLSVNFTPKDDLLELWGSEESLMSNVRVHCFSLSPALNKSTHVYQYFIVDVNFCWYTTILGKNILGRTLFFPIFNVQTSWEHFKKKSKCSFQGVDSYL